MSREISPQVRTSSLQVTECARSLFVLELLHPGPFLYLCTETLCNTPILSNQIGQFGVLFPEIDTQVLRLDDVMVLLATRGVRVRLIHTVVDSVEELLPAIAGTGTYRRGASHLFYQGLLTTKLGLRGRLFFGNDAIDNGGERVELITSTVELERFALELDSYWEELT